MKIFKAVHFFLTLTSEIMSLESENFFIVSHEPCHVNTASLFALYRVENRKTHEPIGVHTRAFPMAAAGLLDFDGQHVVSARRRLQPIAADFVVVHGYVPIGMAQH